MAEPGGADPAGGGMAAAPPPPPPPPPPPQPPPQTETTGTDMAERRGAPTEEQTAGLPQPGQPPVHTEAPGAGTHPPRAPATEKDEGEGSKGRRHEADAPPTSASGEKESTPMKPHQTKRRESMQRKESIPPPQGEVAGGALDAGWARMKKKLQNAGTLVMKIMSWYRRHRSPEPAVQKEKVEETKPSPSPAPQEKEKEEEMKSKQDKSEDQETTKKEKLQENKPHLGWAKMEARLETILEKACRRLVAGEYMKLSDNEQRCLLTFSVFQLGKDVKKQAVTYWWAMQFRLSVAKRDGADRVFTDLSGGGFLEPIKNRCSGVIHGCRVNPLVHWMVKHLAKEKEFADLEDRGNPDDKQPKSAVLCLTAGNRVRLQNLRERDESQSQARRKPAGTKKTSKEPSQVKEVAGPSQDLQSKTSIDHIADQLIEFDKKKVIVNINAHVYRLPELVLSELADRLEVLQLGRWWNYDDKTYMEVEALGYIGKLKNLRYLSLRGLSQLTELPSEFKLRRLAILDLRGCQNLVKVSSSAVTNLKGLTHLDLTECYMLEHIGQGISTLSELQVFKGFVFGVGVQRRKACRLRDLMKLKKLRKLSINITTDTTVSKEEMAQLGKLEGLLSLTVTWGELPSILWGVGDVSHPLSKKKEDLLEGWTGLVLPQMLEKLDVRCYPQDMLPKKWFQSHDKQFQAHQNLKKLYVRGGDVKRLDIPSGNNIETLRLRYLNKFKMTWMELFRMLNKGTIKSVEVVDKDQKVMMNQTKGKGEMVKDDQRKKRRINEEEHIPIKTRMDIPGSTLDENGVWIRDEKDDLNREVKEGGGGNLEGTKEEDTAEVRDGKKIKEGEKKRASSAPTIDQSAAPAISGDVKEGAGTDESGIDKSGGPVKASQQAPRMASKEDAPKTEAATGATDIPKVPDNGGKGDDDGDINRVAEAEDEPATEEDIGDGGEVKNADGGKVKNADGGEVKNADGGDDSDKAQTEGEGEEKDEGQVRRREVRRDTVDEQSTIGEDGGDDDTSSPAVQRPELKEETTPANLIPAAKASASRTATLPAPPASTGPAPAVAGEAAAEPKKPGKAGDDDGLAAGATESTDTTTGTLRV